MSRPTWTQRYQDQRLTLVDGRAGQCIDAFPGQWQGVKAKLVKLVLDAGTVTTVPVSQVADQRAGHAR